jgi:hypothetical protein
MDLLTRATQGKGPELLTRATQPTAAYLNLRAQNNLPKLARQNAYVLTNANRASAANKKAANNAKQQLRVNASRWNQTRRKAAYNKAFQAKYGRPSRSGLNYTLAEHEYESLPPGVTNSNGLVALYLNSKKSRKSTRKAKKNTRRH